MTERKTRTITSSLSHSLSNELGSGGKALLRFAITHVCVQLSQLAVLCGQFTNFYVLRCCDLHEPIMAWILEQSFWDYVLGLVGHETQTNRKEHDEEKNTLKRVWLEFQQRGLVPEQLPRLKLLTKLRSAVAIRMKTDFVNMYELHFFKRMWKVMKIQVRGRLAETQNQNQIH
jgi:hypothetical protein